MRRCETPGCNGRHYGKGLCHKCYNKQYRSGWTVKEKVLAKIETLNLIIARNKRTRSLCHCDGLGLAISLSKSIEEAEQEIIDLKKEYYLFFEDEK